MKCDQRVCNLKGSVVRYPENDAGASKHVAVFKIYTVMLKYICCA